MTLTIEAAIKSTEQLEKGDFFFPQILQFCIRIICNNKYTLQVRLCFYCNMIVSLDSFKAKRLRFIPNVVVKPPAYICHSWGGNSEVQLCFSELL